MVLVGATDAASDMAYPEPPASSADDSALSENVVACWLKMGGATLKYVVHLSCPTTLFAWTLVHGEAG
jgi:hypothetical protein